MRFFIFLLLIIVSFNCQSDFPIEPVIEESTQSILPISMGTIVEHNYYKLAYSEEHEGALWVFYRLTPEFITGPGVRKNNFKEDPLVPTGSSALEDYVGSGYDRGHLCPAASMALNQEAMDESFFMSNMSPQHPSLNRGRWKSLEGKVRNWTESLGEVYVVSGAIYNDKIEAIGANEVTVPKHYYKVIWDNKDKIIGFILPNEKCALDLKSYAVPVDSIEGLTGIDFFSIIPDELETKIESKTNIEHWEL